MVDTETEQIICMINMPTIPTYNPFIGDPGITTSIRTPKTNIIADTITLILKFNPYLIILNPKLKSFIIIALPYLFLCISYSSNGYHYK